MPLLGKKVFNCLKSLNDIKPEETVFTIPHTKEQFRSKAEFEKRKDLYDERIWTCQCTGHINLTHEEAWNSEKAVQKTLKNQFATCFEKPVLEIVHHSTLSLDTLVDQAWLKLQQVLALKEQVSLRIKNAAASGKGFSGTVVMIDTTGVQANPTSNCSSPSSDKENSASEGKETSPKKWVPPKLLPYKYSIKLDDEDKIINSIPASDLVRVDRPPSKELLRLFIRASAIRVGVTSTSPWVVSDSLVKRYSLPSKFADFLLSPAKMAEAAKRAEEECTKKRKHGSQQKQSSAKKVKKLKLSPKESDRKRRSSSGKAKSKKKENFTIKRKNEEDVVVLSEDSSDDEVLATLKNTNDSDDSDNEVLASLKNTNDSDSDTPLVSLKNQLTPKKKKHKSSASDSESDTPLSQLTTSPKKKKRSSPSKTSKSGSPKKKRSKKKEEKTPKKRGRPRKEDSINKGKSSKKGMKQTTLLGIATKKSPGHASSKSPSKSPKKAVSQLPRSVKELAKIGPDHAMFKQRLLMAARVVQPQMFPLLPENIKEVLIKKYEALRLKKQMKGMSQQEKKAFLLQEKQKRKEKNEAELEKKRAALREQQKADRIEKKKRFEDLDLKGSPLPAPKLVPTPDGIPNEYFGDVVMVTEFLDTYCGLFQPDGQNIVTSDDLMKYLASETNKFEPISQVLVILLQTLLQDEIAQGYRELRTPLVDLRLNVYNASELLRLCLRKTDYSYTTVNLEEIVDDEVSEKVLQQLETQDFHQLDPVSKLKIIQGLCLRILGSYSVQDYMETKHKKAIDSCRDHRQKKKQNKKDGKGDENETDVKNSGESGDDKPVETKPVNEKGSILAHFYGKVKEGETDSGSAAAESMDDSETSDLLNTIKSRRIRAAKTALEKERKEREKREQKEREYKEYREQLAREREARMCKDMVEFARRVYRHVPIGVDRNHSRYWFFHSGSPAIYVEKGWVTSDINYNCQSSADGLQPLSTPKKSDSVSGSQPNTPSKKKSTSEMSVPHVGQNLWFIYETPEEIEELIKSLHKTGIRESALMASLQKQKESLIKGMRNKISNPEDKTKEGEEEEDMNGNEKGDEEMLEGFKRELIELENRIRNGGLGGIPKFDAWEGKVLSATCIKELGSCLKEVQVNIADKFTRGMMRVRNMSVVQVKEEEEEEEAESGEDEDSHAPSASSVINRWFKAVEECQTFSRLHVLLGMLESCVKWEKSAENAKCKICRKKGNDEAVLLCDECNQAFHMFCLRPALLYIPRGDWFCPACIPESKKKEKIRAQVKRYNDEEDYDVIEEEEEDIEHEEECAECGGDEGLINCNTCPSAYHLECHNPPLRHPPRGFWKCTACKDGKRRRGSRRSGRTAKVKSYKVSDNEESEEEVLPKKNRAANAARSEPSRSRNRSSSRRREEDDSVVDKKPIFSRRAPSELSIIEQILETVMTHKSAWPFLEAVDKKEVPDYHEIVKHPMDFHTMKNKLVRLSYSSPDQVIQDVALVFRNAAIYNKEDSDIYRCMQEVEKAFIDTLSKKLPFYHYSRESVANGYDDTGRRRSRR